MYKRLTERSGNGISIKETSTNDRVSIWNAIERLAELEDKIENGTLIELPCKVGDTVWQIFKSCPSCPFCLLKEDGYKCCREPMGVLHGIVFDKNCNYVIIPKTFSNSINVKQLKHFGETIFLTKAEAEQKLKELRGNNND